MPAFEPASWPSMLAAAVLALVLLVLLAGSALFSAIEVSFFSMQPLHIERLRKSRAAFADPLARLMENPRRLLSAILLADALTNLPLIVLCLYLMRTQASFWWPFWVEALAI